MHGTLNYLYSDKDPASSLQTAFFYEDHFTHLYQDGLKRIRDKDDEIYYNSLLKALSELNSLQDPVVQNANFNENQRKNQESLGVYEKNIDWLAQKQEKLRFKAYNLQESEQKRLEIEKTQAKPAKIAYNLPFNYIGPIKGWKSRFLEFKRKRSLTFEPKPEDFRPAIDENSRKLANFDSILTGERVEDRLIRKGREKSHKMAENKAKFAVLQEMKPDKPKTSNNHKTRREIIDFAGKLHNDAKKISENRENLIKTEENRFDFKPKINKFKEITRKPLYFIEKKAESLEKSKKKGLNPEEWESFLKRNRNLQENKQNSTANLRKIQENAEIVGCSFRPEINAKTLEILIQANKGEKSLFERQGEFHAKRVESRANYERQKEAEFHQNCPFKPKISQSSKSLEKLAKSPEKDPLSLDKKKEKGCSYKRKKKPDLREYKEKILEDNGRLDAEILAFSE